MASEQELTARAGRIELFRTIVKPVRLPGLHTAMGPTTVRHVLGRVSPACSSMAVCAFAGADIDAVGFVFLQQIAASALYNVTYSGIPTNQACIMAPQDCELVAR